MCCRRHCRTVCTGDNEQVLAFWTHASPNVFHFPPGSVIAHLHSFAISHLVQVLPIAELVHDDVRVRLYEEPYLDVGSKPKAESFLRKPR